MGQKKKILSLFSGCGGMDLGFEGKFHVHKASINPFIHQDWFSEETGNNKVLLETTAFKTVFSNDIRPGAKAAWVPFFQNRGQSNAEQVFHLKSVVDLVKEAKKNGNNFLEHSVDIVTGGFPCQDFSVSGKRKGFTSHKSHKGNLLDQSDDPSYENRGMLYMWMREVIDLVRPKMFIAENVKGLVTLSNVKEIIENDFRDVAGSGYLVIPAKVLNAAEYGVPQNRERVFFIGFHKEDLRKEAIKALEKEQIPENFNPYPQPTHTSGVEKKLSSHQQLSFFEHERLIPFVKVRQALFDLPEPEEAKHDLSQQVYSKAKWYGKHCQGQTEVNLDGIGPTIRAEHHGNIEYRRLGLDKGGRYKEELDRGLQERRLTVRECARLQTFPDEYEFVRKPNKKNPHLNLSASEGYRLIGNAVPPLLAYHLAKRIETLWDRLFI